MIELVLSNTTSFFSGNIENLFKNARRYGFKYVEILPYRWVSPQQILKLEKQYGVETAGIHMPVWWNKTLWQHMARQKNFLNAFFPIFWQIYLGDAQHNPGLALASALSRRRPYVLFHTNVVEDMGAKFDEIARRFHTVIENIPYHRDHDEFFWNPIAVKKEMERRGLTVGQVFDAGHFNQSRIDRPDLNLEETYSTAKPEVIHISYNSESIHILPNEKEQAELKKLLAIHRPRYITLETNPLVSIQKGKLLLEKILHPPL